MQEYSESTGQGTHAIKFRILVHCETKNSHKLSNYDGPII